MGAQLAGQDLPIAFALSSLAAVFVAYNYAKLGRTYISNSGPIEFIFRGLGDNLYTGAASFMLWFIYVSSLALALNLGGVAAVTSSSFIIIYIGVILSHYRLADATGASRTVIVASLAIVLSILGRTLVPSSTSRTPLAFTLS